MWLLLLQIKFSIFLLKFEAQLDWPVSMTDQQRFFREHVKGFEEGTLGKKKKEGKKKVQLVRCSSVWETALESC